MESDDGRCPEVPERDEVPILLRAYAHPVRTREGAQFGPGRPLAPPSTYSLFVDTETRTDPGQALRLGAYQVRKGTKLHKAGLFYDPLVLTAADTEVVQQYAFANGLECLTRDRFIDEIFYPFGYDRRGLIVGFNLPFDLSRLAIGHASARGAMRGGFTFQLTADKRRPRLQIKHLSQRMAFMKFAAPRRAHKGKSERKRNDNKPPRRGFFIDVHTFAAALLSRSFTLERLSKFLNVAHPKMPTDEHGGPITTEYLDYATRDVQTTWECYRELERRFAEFGLKETAPHEVFSEASIGKGYLTAMRVKPLSKVQPDVPPGIFAKQFESYYGGRSEVGIRREIRQVVLCDFISMYPTVATLLRLWPFVIADNMSWRDATDEIRRFLETVTLVELQRPETWSTFASLVQVQPDGDIFPARAPYEGEAQATIGLNRLSSDRPLWFTLPDCIASKLLTGRSPNIIRAIIFEPGAPQRGLKSIDIHGDPSYRVHPYTEDFYKRLIELRQSVKTAARDADAEERGQLDALEQALKIAANATSYGIFIETNVREHGKPIEVMVHPAIGRPYKRDTLKEEERGRFFHPLLATLITGAARLMLAITERLIRDAGLEWAFCDTDSMAIAKPKEMSEEEFYQGVDKIVAWFALLNPYDFGGSILKIEDVNMSLADSRKREPLFCFAVSAKRYALFNIDEEGQTVLRKLSAHGLGHLIAPYDESNPAESLPKPRIDLRKARVALWHHDLWFKIIEAARSGRAEQVNLDCHPALEQPAVSRYGATRPRLSAWFADFNRNLPYERQVKPFNFLLALSADPLHAAPEELFGAQTPVCRRRSPIKPIAPFDKHHTKAIEQAFDRRSGAAVDPASLKSYKQALAQYHLHPESKFRNGKRLDRGPTQRRHVYVPGITYIGKEADRLDEQFHTGFDEEAQIDYGSDNVSATNIRQKLNNAKHKLSSRKIADVARISRNHISAFRRRKIELSDTQLRRLFAAIESLNSSLCGK